MIVDDPNTSLAILVRQEYRLLEPRSVQRTETLPTQNQCHGLVNEHPQLPELLPRRALTLLVVTVAWVSNESRRWNCVGSPSVAVICTVAVDPKARIPRLHCAVALGPGSTSEAWQVPWLGTIWEMVVAAPEVRSAEGLRKSHRFPLRSRLVSSFDVSNDNRLVVFRGRLLSDVVLLERAR
jgi:hypothetical protein